MSDLRLRAIWILKKQDHGRLPYQAPCAQYIEALLAHGALEDVHEVFTTALRRGITLELGVLRNIMSGCLASPSETFGKAFLNEVVQAVEGKVFGFRKRPPPGSWYYFRQSTPR